MTNTSTCKLESCDRQAVELYDIELCLICALKLHKQVSEYIENEGFRNFDALREAAINDPLSARRERAKIRRKHAEAQPWCEGLASDEPLVYFLILGNRIKIGFSRNLRLRLRTLPHERVLAVVKGDAKQEKIFHLVWASERIEGEWFNVTPELLLWIEGLPDRLPVTDNVAVITGRSGQNTRVAGRRARMV